jgi:hypothetical protein
MQAYASLQTEKLIGSVEEEDTLVVTNICSSSFSAAKLMSSNFFAHNLVESYIYIA